MQAQQCDPQTVMPVSMLKDGYLHGTMTRVDDKHRTHIILVVKADIPHAAGVLGLWRTVQGDVDWGLHAAWSAGKWPISQPVISPDAA